jgi:DNA polymerase-3 subunit delta
MIYFLYGQDSFRSKQKLNEIIDGYKKIHKSGLNLIYIDAKEKDFTDFYSNFKVMGMFAEKKLVVIKNIFEKVKFQEEFLEKIKDIDGLKDIVVIYEPGLPDQRLKFFKNLQKTVKNQEFKHLSPAALAKWVSSKFEERGVKINFDALNLLLNFVGNNLWQMFGEINKLANYRKTGAITLQDVELLVKPNIENDIFKTIDALASKNKREALNLLHKHLDNGDNSLYLLSMVAYQFRNLLTIKELQNSRRPLATCGLHPFVVKKSSYLCNYFTYEQLKKIYQKIFQIDNDIKSGKIEPETALDLLVSQI